MVRAPRWTGPGPPAHRRRDEVTPMSGPHAPTPDRPPFEFGPTFTGLANLRDVDPTLRAHGFTVP